MEPLDYNELLKQLLSGTGLLAVFLTLYFTNRKGKSKADRETVNRAHDKVQSAHTTPTESSDARAIGIASDAMAMAKELKKSNIEISERLTEVEDKLKIVSKAYEPLYWKWQDLKFNWDEYREHTNPPDDPVNMFHPEGNTK